MRHPNLLSKALEFVTTHAIFFIIGVICFLTQFFELSDVLRFDRTLINEHEYWRLLTANFIHLNWPHLGMNVGALGLISLLFVNRVEHITMAWVIILSSIFSCTLIYFLDPSMHRLVGFSGTIHGVMVAGCYREWKHDKMLCLLASVSLFIKLGYEQIIGPLPGAEQHAGGKVAVDAHLYGALFGLAVIVIYDFLRRR